MNLSVDLTPDRLWEDFYFQTSKHLLKPTDMNLVKLYIIDMTLSAYMDANKERIGELMARMYEVRLKKQATKQFLKWCGKKVAEISKEKAAKKEQRMSMMRQSA
mmetsp:Transcript_49017/g.36094  ORF Transcript_49017/g.36094 Transcript_49017/m.36094 type:complete len:104 (+) Transcript_49017:433-744(+)